MSKNIKQITERRVDQVYYGAMSDVSESPVQVYCNSHALRENIQALSKRYGLCYTHKQPTDAFYLCMTEHGLELHQNAKQAPGPIYIDFIGGPLGHRRRFGGGRNQPLARAMGIKPGYNPNIIDTTAGIGRDAFVLASLGCAVTLCERATILAALLDDALERSKTDEETAIVTRRMALWHGDSGDYLAKLEAPQYPDVIYLDPMYPASPSNAAVKKDMATLHKLIGPDADSDTLFTLACKRAKKRVVVKRPSYADCLHQHKPHTCIESKKTRYDIYMV